jgi:hypothetical protein
MSKKLYEENDIQAIAAAIRGKNGTTDTYKTSEMAAAINSIPSGGMDLNNLIGRTITSFSNDSVSLIGMGAFNDCTQLTSIDCPNVTRVERSAFTGCNALTTVNLPSVTVFSSELADIGTLTTVNMPNATYLPSDVFNGCTNLTSVTLTNITSIPARAFRGCRNLNYLDLPAVTSIGTGAFHNIGADARPLHVLLRSTTVCRYSGKPGSGSLGGDPQRFLYVPAAIKSQYRLNEVDGWNTAFEVVRALEDYTVDGTITGALDPNKI